MKSLILLVLLSLSAIGLIAGGSASDWLGVETMGGSYRPPSGSLWYTSEDPLFIGAGGGFPPSTDIWTRTVAYPFLGKTSTRHFSINKPPVWGYRWPYYPFGYHMSRSINTLGKSEKPGIVMLGSIRNN